MKLTSEQQQKLISKLNEIWKNKTCEICTSTSWNINDTVFELREFHGGNMVIGGNSSIQPLISLTCNNCGNTKLLNAIKLDVIDSPHQPEQEEKEVEKEGNNE